MNKRNHTETSMVDRMARDMIEIAAGGGTADRTALHAIGYTNAAIDQHSVAAADRARELQAKAA